MVLQENAAVNRHCNKKPPTLESGGVARTGRQGARAYGMVADQDTYNRKGRDQALEGQQQVADQPGNLMLHVRVREGLSEHRETKSVTAVADVTPAVSPFPLRLFLHGWGLTVIAILVIGFAGALVALGDLTSADFIALVVPLAALLGVIAVARGTSDSSPRPGPRKIRGRDYGQGYNAEPARPEP